MTPGRALSGRDPADSPFFVDIKQILLIQSVDIPLVIRLSGRFFTAIGAGNLMQSLACMEYEWNHHRCAVDFHIDNNDSLLRILQPCFCVDRS